jgi:ParB family chromosome partitioning protein
MTHQQAADAVGRSRPAASNLLRLLNLAKPVQELLMAGDLDMGHARALLPLEGPADPARQPGGRAPAFGARNRAPGGSRSSTRARRSPRPRPTATCCGWRRSSRIAIGATVKIKANKKGAGELTIRFGSLDQLDGVLSRLD